METTVKDLQKGQTFELKVAGKRLKSIQQNCESFSINGVNTMCTKAEITSAVESILVVMPTVGFWKIVGDKRDALQFFPREGTCAEFKILLV